MFPNLIEECTRYFNCYVQDCKPLLTAEILCKISKLQEKKILVIHSNVIYYDKTIIYTIIYKEYAIYNLKVVLTLELPKFNLYCIELFIKNYIFTHTDIDCTPLCTLAMSNRKYKHIIIDWGTVKQIGESLNCEINPFIIPFYYIKKHNDLESYMKHIIKSSRQNKNRRIKKR